MAQRAILVQEKSIVGDRIIVKNSKFGIAVNGDIEAGESFG
jgi:hypothetical protein